MCSITGLDVIYGFDTLPRPGYTKIPVNLSRGVHDGLLHTYLCYSTCPGPAITNIQVYASDKSTQIQKGYTMIKKPLNITKGKGSSF
jgi:hypothetical protein